VRARRARTGRTSSILLSGVPSRSRCDLRQPSAKAYSGRRRRPEYAGHQEVRRVSAAGTFRLLSGQYFLSNALKGEEIGLEEVEDDIWSIVYYNTLLGRSDLGTGRITGIDKV